MVAMLMVMVAVVVVVVMAAVVIEVVALSALIHVGHLRVCCVLVTVHPSNLLLHLRDGPAHTAARGATLRQKLPIKLIHPVTVY